MGGAAGVIGTAIRAMGRRGILKGAVGLGAAIGIGAPRSSAGAALNLPRGYVGGDPNIRSAAEGGRAPEWLKKMGREADEASEKFYSRTTFDGLDLDLAMLRSPSPGYKLSMQRARDARRAREQRSISERLQAAIERWREGLLP